MDKLDLSDDDLRRILVVGRRFLINEATRPEDLKIVLVRHLRDSQPTLAEKIQEMSNSQMASLCQKILSLTHSFS
jgi:hypothetical protein